MSETNFPALLKRGLSRAVLCDLLVFLMNLVFARTLAVHLVAGVKAFTDSGSASAPEAQAPTALGYITGGALVAYSLGCWLKRGPLQERLAGDQPDAAGCVLLAWFSLMLSLTILGVAVVMADFSAGGDNGWSMLLIFAAALTPVVLGIRAMGAVKVRTLPAWRRSAWLEIVADVLIIAAILPVSMI